MTTAEARALTTTEAEDLQDHFRRYRWTTLLFLDLLSEEQLLWRPRPNAFNCGQLLLHILSSEGLYMDGLFKDQWDFERMRFPKPQPDGPAIRAQLVASGESTLKVLSTLTEGQLSRVVRPPRSPMEYSLRSWLWFLLEHEIHHKGQLSEHVRQLGLVPPFMPGQLPLGKRPDIAWREGELGGV